MAWILPFVLLGSCDKELVEYEREAWKLSWNGATHGCMIFPCSWGLKGRTRPRSRSGSKMRRGATSPRFTRVPKSPPSPGWRRAETAAGRRCLTGAIAGVCNMPTGFTCRRKANRWRTAYRVPRERPAGRGLCRRRRPVVGQRGVRSRAGRPQQSRRKFGRDRPRYFGAHFSAPDRGTHYDPCPMTGRSRVLAAALCVLPFLAAEVPAQELPRFSCSASVGTGFGLTRPSSVPVVWRVTGHYNVSRRFSVGAGTGVSCYEKRSCRSLPMRSSCLCAAAALRPMPGAPPDMLSHRAGMPTGDCCSIPNWGCSMHCAAGYTCSSRRAMSCSGWSGSGNTKAAGSPPNLPSSSATAPSC